MPRLALVLVALVLLDLPARADPAVVQLYKSGGLFDRKQYRPLREALARSFASKHAETIREAFGEDHEKLTAWLEKRPQVKEELFVALDEQHDDLAAALRLFAELWKAYPERVESHAPLAIATAVVWDRPVLPGQRRGSVYDYREHQARARATMPEGLVDARGNFEYLTSGDTNILGTIKQLPWEFLAFVVNHKTPISERKWAQKYVASRRATVSSWHQDIPYDKGMLRTELTGKGPGPKLAGKEYTLENIKRYGGVCAHQADFVSRVGKSMGQPTVYVWGESSYRGWHAWVMWVAVLKASKTGSVRFNLVSDGRTRGFERDAYYTGFLIDPQTGDRILDRDMERRLVVIGTDPLAARQVRLLMRVYPAVAEELKFQLKDRLAWVDGCLKLAPMAEEPWLELARLARGGESSGANKGALAARLPGLTKTFANYPDFVARLSDDFPKAEPSAAARLRHYERLVTMFEKAGRPDLCCDVRLKITELQCQEKRYKEAAAGLTVAVRKFPTEGRYVPQLLSAYEKVCESYPTGVKPLADLYVELGPALVRHYKEEDSPFIDKIRKQAGKFFEGQSLTKHAQAFQARMVQAGARSR